MSSEKQFVDAKQKEFYRRQELDKLTGLLNDDEVPIVIEYIRRFIASRVAASRLGIKP